MIDKAAFRSLSYGLYVISTKDGDRSVGCIVNTFAQVTSTPLQVIVALNKENATTKAVQATGRFAACCLSQDATIDLIGTFGFYCSDDCDKFATCAVAYDGTGMPHVDEQCVAHFSVRVVNSMDVGTHILFVGEVEEAWKVSDDAPLTYAYYHQVKGGKTPPKASSYLPPDDVVASVASESGSSASGGVATTSGESPAPKIAWRCPMCGHLEYVDQLPDGYTCLVCGVGGEMFERVEL